MNFTRVLWIEDNASSQFEYMATPVVLDGRFDLNVATSASEGIRRLHLHGPFEVVVVDVRLPAGEDLQWKEFAQLHGTDEDPCLGLEILRQLFLRDDNHKKFGPPVSWAKPKQFGVLTVENHWGRVQRCLKDCGIGVFRSKTADQGERVLIEIVEEILSAKKGG